MYDTWAGFNKPSLFIASVICLELIKDSLPFVSLRSNLSERFSSEIQQQSKAGTIQWESVTGAVRWYTRTIDFIWDFETFASTLFACYFLKYLFFLFDVLLILPSNVLHIIEMYTQKKTFSV